MSNKPTPDIYQDERFSTPQFIYNKRQDIVGQVSIGDDGFVWFREATIKHEDWGLWVKTEKLTYKQKKVIRK
tara:strand:- start:240 stop:455 length:216 start_codon:yes stop_codon:yes gene_type:complete